MRHIFGRIWAMTNNKNNLELYIKLLLNYFDKHKIQAAIFFFQMGLCFLMWSVIVAIYTGIAINDAIKTIIKCL